MATRHNQRMFKEFRNFSVDRQEVTLNCFIGGEGPPLLLLHGHPQTHVMRHLVAPQLASRFTVVMMDLRGYGDSGRPQSIPNQATYSKREMAQDAVAVMKHLKIDQFDILAHDRGARVAHRLALDHPNTVGRLLLLDIALDAEDQLNGLQMHQPLKIIWGQKGAVGQCFDVLSLWRECASNVTGIAFPCGHYIAEEAASELLVEAFNFFKIH